MSQRDDLVTLRQMLDHAREIQTFSANVTFDNLRDDRLLQLALIRLLEIIGEAATRVSQECRKQHPQIPWIQIIGLRNRLIHAYDAVDLAIVWIIITSDVPQLADAIESIVETDSST